MKRLLLLLPLLALASGSQPLLAFSLWSQPPETSSGNPRVDCAKFKTTWAAEKRAGDSVDYAFEKLKPILYEIGEERAIETEESDHLVDMSNAHRIKRKRKASAIYAVTKHLGYSQQERTRMWDYNPPEGKLLLKYYELPEEEREGNLGWLMMQGLPKQEAEDFCKALGINPSPYPF